MTNDTHHDPRCVACDTTLMRAGATCPTCDHDEHFEGALRTAPPITSNRITSDPASAVATVRP